MTTLSMKGPGSRLVVYCALVVLAGCASLGPQLPMTMADETSLEDVPLGIRTLAANGEFDLLSSGEVARRLQAALGDRPLSILAISSGGASGAFGAGALVGSTRHGVRPEFTVVTGVSVGALLAPFAFLGPAWNSDMTSIFTTGETDGLLQPRLLGAVFGSSLYSGAPLQRLIEHHADDAMIAAVAAEAAKGRLLLIATTDFSTGEPVVWDLGSVALHGGADAKRLFQTLLRASASVPGMLPPVVVRFRCDGRIREETHVDGGVTLPFFIAPAPEDLPQPTAGGAQPTLVRVIIDGPLRHIPHRARANIFTIMSRSLSAGLSHVTRATLESTVEAVRQRRISLDYAAIPTSYPLAGAFDFHAATERSLFEYAATCAGTGRLWVSVRPGNSDEVAEGPPVSGQPMCPADDEFIGRLAALEN
jgi:predicted acylesterase/phospholipase RssA